MTPDYIVSVKKAQRGIFRKRNMSTGATGFLAGGRIQENPIRLTDCGCVNVSFLRNLS